MVGIIIGNQNPLLGTTYSYEIKPFGLSFGSNKYEWYLYKKQKNGTWKDITGTPKTGEKVTYRFGEPGLGIEFEMKVYETKQGILPGMPSSKQLAGSMKLIPTSNTVPKIEKVVLFNRGARDVNKASYRDTLIAQAHCIGMFNKDIEFHLWEDDAPGKGHNSTINKNNRHTRTYTARVNEKGIAEIGIPLMSDERVLRQMANKLLMKGDQNEGANHEYYVTASYSGKIMGASQTNVDVANPDHKTGQQPTQPKSQPQTNTPKFPTGQGGGPRHPDPKGNIIEAVFVDSSGKELSKVAVGNKVHVRIHSKNMVGKYIQYVIWEYDMGSNDEVYRSGNIKIPADLCDTMGFVITKDIFKKGVDSLIPNDPDQKTQNYFIEIISKDLAAESKKFGVSSEGLLTVENPLSPSGVQNTPKPETPSSTKCPRCEKVTLEELQKIFTGVKEVNHLEEIVTHFNKGAKHFGINTCLKKAHFFAQVLKETGNSLTIKSPESMNYSTDALKNGFWYSEGTNWVKGDLKNKKGGYYGNGSKKSFCNLSYFKSHPDIAEKYGRKDLNHYKDKGIQIANEDMLANHAYSNKYGNGSVESGDGSKYRGKGLIQLTWKENYEKVNSEITVFDESVDIVSNPNKILTDKKYAVYSAMGFWKWKKINDVINKDKSPDIVDKVTFLINKDDDAESKRKRKTNFQNITSQVFRINECEPGVAQPSSKEPIGKWHDPVDKPRRTKYNSSGNIKPVSGAYGDVRDGYTKYHSGLDLFALPFIQDEFIGTPVYACLDGEIVESTPGNSAGQTIRIKIKNVKDLLEQEKKINYQLEFKKGEERGIDIKESDDVYLIYMHLSKRLLHKGDVTAGTLIGYSGVSGSIANKIPSPHLHLEIATVQNAYGTGKTKRTNPARFIKLNSYDTKDQDDAVNYKYTQDGKKIPWKAPKTDQRNL